MSGPSTVPSIEDMIGQINAKIVDITGTARALRRKVVGSWPETEASGKDSTLEANFVNGLQYALSNLEELQCHIQVIYEA